MASFWHPVTETPPYDEVILFRSEDGNVFQDFVYDCTWEEWQRDWGGRLRSGPIVAWAKIPPLDFESMEAGDE